MVEQGKRPVTIVTGFLGSGKTTLLCKFLQDPAHERTTVLVNEFGKVALDHHLLRQVRESTVVLGGGCVCCAVRDDLVREMKNILNDTSTQPDMLPERIIIETSGLADPAPIVFTILTDPVLQHHFYIAEILTTLDAVNGALHLSRQRESVKQISVADKVLLTKTDIAEAWQTQDLLRQVHRLNPTAEVIRVGIDAMDAGIFLGSTTANREVSGVWGNVAENVLTIKPDVFTAREKGSAIDSNSTEAVAGAGETTESEAQTQTYGSHEDTVKSISLTFDQSLDWTAFGIWLSMLLFARGEDVLRVKGIIDVGEAGPVVLNGVQHIIHPPEHLATWPEGKKGSKLVFIMRDIAPEDVLSSLQAFQGMLGATAFTLQMNTGV